MDDVVFVLDGLSGEYFALDPTDSRLWRGLIDGADPWDEASMAALLSEARALGWLGSDVPHRRRTSSHRAPAPFRRLPTLAAYTCLVRSYLFVRWLPFGRTISWAEAAAHTVRSTPATPLLDAALAAFSRAEHGIVPRLGSGDCLPRSLALFVFLRRLGVPAVHRIGVRRYPFRSHAWVEHEAAPLLDSPSRVAHYTPIMTLGEEGAG